jgi:hypothetical protein
MLEKRMFSTIPRNDHSGTGNLLHLKLKPFLCFDAVLENIPAYPNLSEHSRL